MADQIEQLILNNIPLVYHIVHTYYPTFAKNEDVIQSGMLGLTKAANKYDESKGKFSTYACVAIRNEINNELKIHMNDSRNVSLEKLMEGSHKW